MKSTNRKAWKCGYRSFGGARRIVFQHLKKAGFEFDGFPEARELVEVFCQHHLGGNRPEGIGTRGALIWAAEHFLGLPHKYGGVAHHKKQAARRYSRESAAFLRSDEWYALRQLAFQKYGRRCMRCKIDHRHAVISVDHIKPRKDHPELALELSNLQILCRTCNGIKSNRDDTDWREPSLRVLMGEAMK